MDLHQKINILVIGNGGREHTLAWKILQSPLCQQLFVAPGNAGTALIAQNIPIRADQFQELADFCILHTIHLVVVGPEVPLVNGIRDFFESIPALSNVLMVGPGKSGARLEGSKDFSKHFMLANGIPTAKAKTFTVGQLADALTYIDSCTPPIVLKADGLAAGKGVIITNDRQEAKASIHEMLALGKFGEASSRVLIEEFLEGIELSVFVLTDGDHYVILPEAKDYKRIGEGDQGPNTGGMGSVSPVPFATPEFMQKVEKRIIQPTIEGLKKEAIPFKGFLFIGLMNCDGEPYVIEYNTRLGDPETQSVIPRIKNDLVELFLACASGNLDKQVISVDPQYAVSVVMVAKGYPDDYQKGRKIHGINLSTNWVVFQAGTRQHLNDTLTDGGRVLAVNGMATSLTEAIHKSYQGINEIHWEDAAFRKDIGKDLLKYL